MSSSLAISPDNYNDFYSQLMALLAQELNDNNPNTTEIINDYLLNNPNAFPPLNNYINTSINTTSTTSPTTPPPPTTPPATSPTPMAPPIWPVSNYFTPPSPNMVNNINNYISSLPIDDNNDSSSDDSYFDDMPELLISDDNDDDLYDSDSTVCAYPSAAPYP